MPRNASGNFTLPLPAVVTGTVIESVWANTTMNDLAASITDSLDRYGRGGMVAPFRMVDGTVSVPAISFASETNTGLYRVSAGVASISVLGVEQQTWTSAGTTVANALNVIGELNATGPLEIGGGIQITGGVSRFFGGSAVLVTNSANAALAPFTTRWFVSNVTPIFQVLGTTAATAGILAGRFSADNAPAFLFLSKSRNTTVGSHTIVQTGDCIGGIHYGASDGIQILDAARIAAFVDAAPGVDVMPTRLSFWTTITNQPVERMRISPEGYVGIATTTFLNGASNRALIEMSGATDAMIAMKITGSNRASLLAGTNFDLSAYGVAAAMTFTTNAAERMRLDASGNLGIGVVANSLPRLHLKNAAESARFETTVARGGGSCYMTFFDPSGRKGYVGYGGASDHFYVNNELVGGMYLMTSAITRLEIAATGQIGVGAPPNVGQFDVQSSGAGIISKTSSENGTVAALGVWNLNPNALQWYISCNGTNTDMHFPRGNGFLYVGGVGRLVLTPTQVNIADMMQVYNGPHFATAVAGPPPYFRLFYSGVIEWRIIANAAGALEFNQSGTTPRLRIDTNGSVIVNQSFAGLQNVMGESLEAGAGYGIINHANGTANGTNYWYFGYNAGVAGQITQTGATTVNYGSGSDARLKQDIVAMPDVGAIIDALQPREFAWTHEPDVRARGLVAQEVVAVLPELVTHDLVYDSWAIDFGKLTPVLLREIQSLRARVAALGG